MDRSSLNYADLSFDTIKHFHKHNGCLMIELTPLRGKLLLSLLEQRDRMERDTLMDTAFFKMVWHYFVWVFYESNVRLFAKRLLILQRYLSEVDAAYGWETNQEGNQVFVLLPLNKERHNMALITSMPVS